MSGRLHLHIKGLVVHTYRAMSLIQVTWVQTRPVMCHDPISPPFSPIYFPLAVCYNQ